VGKERRKVGGVHMIGVEERVCWSWVSCEGSIVLRCEWMDREGMILWGW
jgi:hypothetical protein